MIYYYLFIKFIFKIQIYKVHNFYLSNHLMLPEVIDLICLMVTSNEINYVKHKCINTSSNNWNWKHEVQDYYKHNSSTMNR